MVISDVISDGVIHCCVKRALCSFVLVKSCKCNEDHLGFMKTYSSALGIRSNMAFLFLDLHVCVHVCMCNWVFLWCLSFCMLTSPVEKW